MLAGGGGIYFGKDISLGIAVSHSVSLNQAIFAGVARFILAGTVTRIARRD